ncbi:MULTISPECIES: WhiB family transcriptional regulator [Streptosporangium]|uniref:4Fe-4S Wbl-type domain-containing protein n=1 Tax=Streptosporangium brasiliense TaxID=47480 RepID=A0ABT9RNY4_9ACTN|nr:WhiB family transcriptional regulator [Streptosporangium brasiliense]MDP9870424.1 hypothetical protein [Streptosporangium brasiliense]
MVLKPRVKAPDWRAAGNDTKAAKCLKFPPDLSRGYDPWFDVEYEIDCLDICNGESDGRRCPMRDTCLDFALINNETGGVWGGMLPHDRRNLRLARRADPYLELKWHPPTPKPSDFDEDDLLLLD